MVWCFRLNYNKRRNKIDEDGFGDGDDAVDATECEGGSVR